jgi:hypothetical protein
MPSRSMDVPKPAEKKLRTGFLDTVEPKTAKASYTKHNKRY